ncbi:unnamed protein product [Mycena citricolor]|uniref:Uncharacterized protein n=1 Tax=Mycena citricolor TaxID=2018698 RepID=A0AAD2JUX3_9AGAR|nr:unnamed protein product [Mycena citricolor]
MVANLLLLIVTLIVQGSSTNLTLVNLVFIFFFLLSTNSVLVWTGHVLEQFIPFLLCLFNALVNMSNVLLMAGRGTGNGDQGLGNGTDGVLLALLYVASIPVFVAGILLGINNREQVFHGLPLYCVVKINSIQMISTLLDALFCSVSLILAGWIAIKLLLTQQTMDTLLNHFVNNPLLSVVFVTRVMVFLGFVLAALI